MVSSSGSSLSHEHNCVPGEGDERDREQDPAKQWKITDEDWRNRDKYPQYKAAVEDIFRLTSTPFAPWIILESDDKRYARVKALKIINDALEARLREN